MDPHMLEMVKRLYTAMPGMVLPPREYRNGEEVVLWGEVENTREWELCEQIAREIINAAQAYAR